MVCFQYEQTAGCKACEGMLGVCGKKADTAELQDKLTGALIGLARAAEGNEHVVSDSTAAVIVEGLFATLTNVNFDNDALRAIMDLKSGSCCGVNELTLSMVLSWYEQKAVCILLTLLHSGIKNIRLGPMLPAFVSPNVLILILNKNL